MQRSAHGGDGLTPLELIHRLAALVPPTTPRLARLKCLSITSVAVLHECNPPHRRMIHGLLLRKLMQMPADNWLAADYARHSTLQEAMAAEVMGLFQLRGDERVLDVGCGDGRLSARIADRLPTGQVLGIDASADMIAFAAAHFDGAGKEPRRNLRFEVADARALHYPAEFDLVISFNALHWVPDQGAALRGIAASLRPMGRAMLRLVIKGTVTSLEEVAEATRRSPRWAPHFAGFTDPYLRLEATQYAALARREGLRVQSQHTDLKAWDFRTHDAFFGFCRAGFGAWTHCLPDAECDVFVDDVISAYRIALAAAPDAANVFRFYQMDIALAHPAERWAPLMA